MICLQVYFDIPQGAIVIVLRLIQITMIWIVADFLTIEKFPQWVVKMSFIIYVAHHIFLESIEKCFWIVFGNMTAGAVLEIICAPTFTILLIIGIAKVLQTYIPKSWSVLNGGRN